MPVYAVYGNHEDVCVIRELKSNNIENLYLLDEDNIFKIGDDYNSQFQLFGVGGNFLVSNKLLRRLIAGQAGKVWATLHQFGVLYQKLEQKSKSSIFVSHVSLGKESLLTRLISHFVPNLWVSGHMGAPYTCVWNQFTIRDMDESLQWFQSQLARFDSLSKANFTDEAMIAYDIIIRDIPRSDTWYKKMWNINLPDAKDGYAVLTFDSDRFSLGTHCTLN